MQLELFTCKCLRDISKLKITPILDKKKQYYFRSHCNFFFVTIVNIYLHCRCSNISQDVSDIKTPYFRQKTSII